MFEKKTAIADRKMPRFIEIVFLLHCTKMKNQLN